MAIKIDRIDAGSEAEALGLQPGDELLSVDENELNDTLDYDFYTDSSSFHLKAKVADGIREWDVRRAERGPFGCDFSTYLGDQKHSCSNHCMFCFIDQLPPGMRESLYFKDDDERLSFLFGNYITMTNMQDTSVARLFSEQKCTISQTDKFAAEPNTKAGVRGEDFTAPWSLTASYAPSKTNRILTIIQVEADGNRIVDIKHADSNSFQCGDWKIEAELNTKRPASLYIRNSKTQTTFSYGKEKPVINGQVYESKDKNSSILYDGFNGKWEVQEMKDRPAQATGNIGKTK